MPAPFRVLVLDLHNTLYDEVGEYGLAIDEAIKIWLEEAGRRQPIERETLYRELSAAHQRLGSDWDPEVWRELPSLARLSFSEKEFSKILAAAETCRRKKSRELTLKGAYAGTHETLTALKARGNRIYVMTEAAADAAMNAIAWLKLAGVVDGVYSYPSRLAPQPVRDTWHRPFPAAAEGSHLKKPHPLLIATLALDDAIRAGEIPEGVAAQDVFAADADASMRLTLRDTPHAAALRQSLDRLLYVGDSKFKDGMLARNAGVAFAHAAYGKKIKPGEEANYQRSLELMYAVTGWDKEVMKLTQEASHSASVDDLQPDYTFENGLSEALGLFAQK